jgi:hypothetical protein
VVDAAFDGQVGDGHAEALLVRIAQPQFGSLPGAWLDTEDAVYTLHRSPDHVDVGERASHELDACITKSHRLGGARISNERANSPACLQKCGDD